MPDDGGGFGPGVQGHVAGFQVGQQRLGQPPHAAGDAGDVGTGRGGLPDGAHRGGQRPVGGHRGAQPRHHRVHVQHIRIRRVHPACHRRDQFLQHGITHPGAHQLAQAELLAAQQRTQRHDLVARGAQRRPAADGAHNVRVGRVCRNAEHPRLGQPLRTVRQLDPGAGRVRLDNVVAQAQFADQVGDHAGAGRERFGAGVEHQPAYLVPDHAATEPGAALQDRHLDAGQRQLARSDQAADPAADDDGGARPGLAPALPFGTARGLRMRVLHGYGATE